MHGKDGLEMAQKLTQFLFSRNTTPESSQTLRARLERSRPSPDTKQIARTRLEEGVGILDLLTELGICSSKGEARRSIEGSLRRHQRSEAGSV